MSKPRRQYTREFKLAAVKVITEQRSRRVLCREPEEGPGPR